MIQLVSRRESIASDSGSEVSTPTTAENRTFDRSSSATLRYVKVVESAMK